MTLLAMGLVLALAVPANGEPSPPVTPQPPPPPRVTTIPPQGMMLFAAPDPTEAPPLSQRPVAPLDARQMTRLYAAQRLRDAGELGAARDTLLKLLAVTPHHPLVLAELARVEGARGDWAAVEHLARAERASQHDSLLLGRDLAQALEQLRRPREAAAVVLEGWLVRAADSDWAVETLTRLAMNDSRGVRDLLRHAAADHADRVDFQSAAAALDWKMGDGPQALKSIAASDRPGLTPPLRWRFAEALLGTGAARDSAGAVQGTACPASTMARVWEGPSGMTLPRRRAPCSKAPGPTKTR